MIIAEGSIDPDLLRAWLAARSIARGLPAPISDRGGFRVETRATDETLRWVFPCVCEGLVAIAQSITEPRHLLKACTTTAELMAVLPPVWRSAEPRFFMMAGNDRPSGGHPGGYTIPTVRDGDRIEVRVLTNAGDLAASGHAVETDEAFVYDRIATAPGHRRKGLGTAVMGALRDARRRHDTPQLLVTTEAGRALYAALGWRTISPYATASIPDRPGTPPPSASRTA